jgi:hypothetical protein
LRKGNPNGDAWKTFVPQKRSSNDRWRGRHDFSLTAGQSLAQGVPGNSQYGVKALFFDMFGTVLDWRTGVARSVEATSKPRGYSLDWLAFADAWREQYDPGFLYANQLEITDVWTGRILNNKDPSRLPIYRAMQTT